jgi:hypothetical protein
MAPAEEHDDEHDGGHRSRLEALTGLWPRWLRRRGWDEPIHAYMDDKARNIACHNYRKRTGLMLSKARVHEDHEAGGWRHDCSDDYMRAMVAGLEAEKDWDGDRPGGMSLQAFILWRMFRAGNDTSWFRAGVTMPKAIIYAYLATAELNNDTEARRLAWLDMGYDGHLFDRIHGFVNWKQSTIPGVADDWDGEESDPTEAPDDGPNVVDPEFEGQLRLFETEDLTDVELLVYKFRQQGYTNAEIDDMIPDALLPKAPAPSTREQKVSQIHAEALRKRARFFNYTD